MLPMPWMEETSVTIERDNTMDPTALCDTYGCGHVRWLHGPYPANPCTVLKCVCDQGWSFHVAKYEGNAAK